MQTTKSLLLIIIILSVIKLNAQNYSLKFNGTNSKVVIPHNVVQNTGNNLTVEAWINADTWKPQQWAGTIIGKDGDISGIASGYVLRAGNNGTLSFAVTPSWNEITSLPIMKTGKWYHVAGVYNGNDASLKIYINGVLQATKTKNEPINDCNLNLLIGECPGFAGRVFDGKIDEVRIWNIARTEAEIRSNMSVSLTGNEPGLVAYYNLNDGPPNSIATDITTNANNGTLSNIDNNNDWVGGFELAQNDIGSTSIISPASSPEWNETMRVKIEIKNYAFNDISNFQVSYSYNGKIITENVTTNIAAFQTYTHTFNSFIDLSDVTNANIKAWTNLTGDTDASNDTSNISIYKSNIITVFDHVQHNFSNAGQTHSKTIYLPENLDKYNQILMHISLSCPTTGCDPWDQPAKITLIKGQNSYEIGRYVTPYNKACGPWTVDITDFKSVLTGKCEIQSYIQVWGASGWLLTLNFEFVEGLNQYTFSKLTNLWNVDYWIYGDPAINDNLPVQIINIGSNTEAAQVRMTNSGHGQANTNNAAEFFDVYHHLVVNEVDSFEHHLWKPDCNVNPCSPQSGTWQYARAGWCPGQQVIPVWWNLEGLFNQGENVILDYKLQEYTNLLNTGYNGSSHTEPHYRIHSYLIEYSSVPFYNFVNAELSEIISPVNGEPNPTNNETVKIRITNKGTTPLSNFDAGYYVNDGTPVFETISNEILPGASLDYTFMQNVNLSTEQYSELVAFINIQDDVNSLDDAKRIWVGTPTFVNEFSETKFRIYPNPAVDYIKIESIKTTTPVLLSICDILGRVLVSEVFMENISLNINNLKSGTYLIILETGENTNIKKLIKK